MCPPENAKFPDRTEPPGAPRARVAVWMVLWAASVSAIVAAGPARARGFEPAASPAPTFPATAIGTWSNPQTGLTDLRRLPPVDEPGEGYFREPPSPPFGQDAGPVEPIELPTGAAGPDGGSEPGHVPGGAASTDSISATAATPTAPAARLWHGSAELGLDGTEGNSRTFNIRVGFDVKRETETWIHKADFDYKKKTNRSEETANRAFLDWRAERLLVESPWSLFGHGTLEYDEFKPFDIRVSVDLGVGGQLIHNQRSKLTSRTGAGFSREIGGPDNDFVPELVFGADVEHRFTERGKLKGTVEYTPDVTQFGEYRLRGQVSWESVLDERMNLSLKLTAQDIYDSTPDGAEPNELDYAAMLMWSF